MQERDRYCDAVAGSTINGMNTSTNTNQNRGTARIAARTTAAGFQRRTMAGALLIMGITATAVGLAAPGHADDGVLAPNAGVTATVPPPAAPWIPTFDQFRGYWHAQCGFPGWRGPFQCWY